jgi:O-antigen/teichoic acid export membrane protein
MISIKALYSDKLVKISSLLFIASMVTSVSNYAFQIVMGRLLVPAEYG